MQQLRGDTDLPRVDDLNVDGRKVHAKIEFDDLPLTKAALHYATAAEPINKLTWQTVEYLPGDAFKVDAEEEEAMLDFELPVDAKVWFITITGGRGAMTSSVPVIAPPE